jgi:iron(III) transport system permease protein
MLVMGVFVLAPAFGFASLLPASLWQGLHLSHTQLYAMRETALLMAGVGVFASITGVGAAWLVSLYTFPLRRALEIGLILPLAFPTYLAAYVAVDALDYFGPIQTTLRNSLGIGYRIPDIRNLPGAVLVLGLVLFPYIYVPARLVFSQGGRSVIDAARLLGASGFGLFWRIGLPLVRPALVAGLVLAMLETLNDIGAVEHLGISSLSLVIRDLWLNRGDLPGAARLAGLLLFAVAILLMLDRPGRAGAMTGRTLSTPRFAPLAGARGGLATVLLSLPVLFGFVLPVLFLIWRAGQYGRLTMLDRGFFEAGIASFGVAISVSCIVMALGAGVAMAIRLKPSLSLASRVAGFGYAVPGTVLVLAILPVLRMADDALEALGSHLLLSGTILAVLYALCVRFLGLGTAQAHLALQRLPRNLDHVARVHGRGDLRLALGVHLPAILPSLTFGGMLVFIDTIKELPATILLRPLNFETLATRAYAKAGAGLFEHAALESLLIVLLSGVTAFFVAQARR